MLGAPFRGYRSGPRARPNPEFSDEKTSVDVRSECHFAGKAGRPTRTNAGGRKSTKTLNRLESDAYATSPRPYWGFVKRTKRLPASQPNSSPSNTIACVERPLLASNGRMGLSANRLQKDSEKATPGTRPLSRAAPVDGGVDAEFFTRAVWLTRARPGHRKGADYPSQQVDAGM